MPLLNGADAVYVGTQQADRVYLGGTLVWERETAVTSATLTVPSGTVSADQANFITRVASLPSGLFASAGSNGGNLRVKKDGVVIPFDLVSFNQGAQTIDLFFKHTLLAGSNNVFTIDTSGSGLLPATDANGRNAVWSDYTVVLMAGDTTNRTGTGSASATGTVTTQSDGWWDLPGGGNGFLSIGSLARHTQWTSAASLVTDKTSGDQHFLSYGVLGTSNTTVATQAISGSNHRIWNSTNNFSSGGAAATIGTRCRTHLVQDATTSRTGYRNATQFHTGGTSQRPGGSGACGLYVGTGIGGSANSLDGRINYAYLRGSVLDASWIAAEVLSWETPGSFYTFS